MNHSYRYLTAGLLAGMMIGLMAGVLIWIYGGSNFALALGPSLGMLAGIVIGSALDSSKN